MVSSVRTRRAFSVLSSSRNRGRSGPVWVVRADAPADVERFAGDGVAGDGVAGDGDRARVAYALDRTVGAAVVRNRVRRRLRALMTELERDDALAPGLYLVGVTPDAVHESFSGLRDHLCRALSRTTAGAR